MAPSDKTEKPEPATVDNRPPFDPYDTARVKYSKIGIWDFYEEILPKRAFGLSTLPGWNQIEMVRLGLPPFFQLVRELLEIPGLWIYLLAHISLTIVVNILPTWQLWYSSRLLILTQQALETRTYDERELLSTILGSIICVGLNSCSWIITRRVEDPLAQKIDSLVKWKVLQAQMRLDYPTSEDPSVQRQFDTDHNAWEALRTIFQLGGSFIQLFSQLAVLFSTVSQDSTMIMCTICDCIPSLAWTSGNSLFGMKTWAATTNEQSYKNILGISQVTRESGHRKELIAGNLQQFLLSKWKTATEDIGGTGSDFHETYWRETGKKFHWSTLLGYWSGDLSLIVIMIQAIRNPASLPASYAALSLSREVSRQLSMHIGGLHRNTRSFGEKFNTIRRLDSLPKIPNLISDGSKPFPENSQDLRYGISLEFIDVSFKYPGNENFALEKVSLKIEKGQLCVIVGTNGSGKSTLLKLLLRLYDPLEGQILIDGIDIKTLRIADLRGAVSALFQDFTIFPLSIGENIGIGDPAHADDKDRIARAAELGGATSIIEKLPSKFDSYLEAPVYNHYSNLPEGTLSLFGHKKINFYGESRAYSWETHDLSGGEKQRLALSRTFMRYLDDENGVAMLVFDEPSASLDPEAEYMLFERLRKLRGTKTMLFSSHRFGNLTRHADLILFMKESHVVERGTHSELVALGGGYASMYNVQAAAFLEETVTT